MIFPKILKNQKEYFKGAFWGFIFCVFSFAVASDSAFAGILPPDWNRPVEEVNGLIKAPEEGNAVEKIKTLFWGNIVPIFKYVMVAVSIFCFILYLIQMLTSSGDEEAIGSSKKNLLWGTLGFMVIALSVDLAQAFDVWRNGGEFVDRARIESAQLRLVSYFQLLAGIVAIFYIFFAGFRLVTSHGDEEIITAQKNHIKWGFVGLMFVMLADAAVNRIFYPYGGQRGLGRNEIQTFFAEGTGVLRFFLTFVGILALISLIASGVVYVTSAGDEGATEKVKKNIIGSLIAIVIIIMSYIFVVSFVPPGAVQP